MVTHAQYFRPVWQREGYEDTLPPNDLMSSLDSMKDEETRYLDHYLAGLMCSKYHDPELYPKDCSDYRALLSECLAAVVRGVNILESFAYCKDGFELPMIRNAKRFILDSGAFTFMASHPKNLDWDDYLRRYGEYVRDNGIERFMELDIDSIVGYPRVLELRSELERIVERPCIPVWHKSRGIEEFRRMCEDYDYVAIGGIVNGELARKEYRFLPALIREAHDRGARIHSARSRRFVPGVPRRIHAERIRDGQAEGAPSGPAHVPLHLFDACRRGCGRDDIHQRRVLRAHAHIRAAGHDCCSGAVQDRV